MPLPKFFFCIVSYLVVLAVLPAKRGTAQTISGRVVDGQGAPVESAVVSWYPQQQRTLTNGQGKFTISISGPTQPEYLEVKHVAYQTQRVHLSELPDPSNIKVVLEEAVATLQEVTVVEPGLLQQAIDNSQSVVTIDQDFIARNSTGTFSGALAALPGVNTINVGVGIAKPVIRGMSFNRIAVVNRGIKQEGQQWGADHGLEVDPFDVERVEIVKGPASLFFGSDGMGGVIRIKENRPLSENGHRLELNTQYQTNNRAVANSLGYKGRKNAWYYSARLTHQDYGDYTIPANEFTYAGFNLPVYENRLKNTAGNELHFSGQVGYYSARLKTSLQFSSFNQKAGIFSGAIGLPQAYNLRHQGRHRDIDTPRQENQHNMLTSNTTLLLGNHSLEVDLGFQYNTRQEMSFPGAHGIPAELAGSNLALGLYLSTYTANLRHQVNPSPAHQIISGGQFQLMDNQKAGFEFLLPEFTSTQAGIFHYHLYELSPKLTVNGGLRYDRGAHSIQQHLQPDYDRTTRQPTGTYTERTPSFNRNFENFSGAVGAIYKATDRHHLKLNLGNSFRFPTAIELSSNGVHHGNYRHEVGNKNLTPENGYQADFTYLHQTDNLLLEVAAYMGYYRNYIYLDPSGQFTDLPTGGGTKWRYTQNDALFNGYELSGSYRFPFKLQADLAVDFVQNVNLDERRPLPLTPPASVFSTLTYSTQVENSGWFNQWGIFAAGRYNFAQERIDKGERPTPDSFILDAGINLGLKLGRQAVTCRLSGRNLLNTAYFMHTSRYRLLNLPEQGRNFMVALRLPINLE
jgi:iron complex outermembrane receptor protein